MNESVVESSLDVAHSEDVLSVLSWSGLWRSVVDDLLLLLLSGISSLLSFGLRLHTKKHKLEIIQNAVTFLARTILTRHHQRVKVPSQTLQSSFNNTQRTEVPSKQMYT